MCALAPVLVVLCVAEKAPVTAIKEKLAIIEPAASVFFIYLPFVVLLVSAHTNETCGLAIIFGHQKKFCDGLNFVFVRCLLKLTKIAGGMLQRSIEL